MRHSTDRLTFVSVSALLIAVSGVYLIASAVSMYPNVVYYNSCMGFWNNPGDHHGGLRHFSGGSFYGQVQLTMTNISMAFDQKRAIPYRMGGKANKLDKPNGFAQFSGSIEVQNVMVSPMSSFDYIIANTSITNEWANGVNNSYALQVAGTSGWPGTVVQGGSSSLTIPFFNSVLVCSNTTTTSQLCEAKCGNTGGVWDPVGQTCYEYYPLLEFCAVVQTNLTVYPPNTIVGSDMCYNIGGQTSAYMFDTTALPNTTTTYNFNISVQLRDWSDPYLVGMQLTNGTLNFSPNLSVVAIPSMAVSGFVLLANILLIGYITKRW